MRKITAALYISLDGVTEAPETWQFDYFNAEMAAGLMASMAEEDAVLLGRVTYQQWAAYWPNSSAEPYASHINNIPKYVVSSTLEEVKWSNSRLVKGSLAEAITRLKQQPGKNIGVAGSVTLTRWLLMNGLLDELTLMIFPVIVGHGRRLFDSESELKRLELASWRATSSGVVILTYTPRGEPAADPEAAPAARAAV